MIKVIKWGFIGLPLVLAASIVVPGLSDPETGQQITDKFNAVGAWLTELFKSAEANPLPFFTAVGTFLITVVYYRLRGHSFRESVEVAATRVTIINPPAAAPQPEQSSALNKARNRTIRNQLIHDQIALQQRAKKLPNEVRQAEQDVCYTQTALDDAKEVLTNKQKAHDTATAKLDKLKKEASSADGELASIAIELLAMESQV